MEPDKEETTKEITPKKKRTVLARIANVLSYILVSVVLLIILIVILIQTAPVQNFLRGKIQTYLQNKLKTKVEIGKLRLRIPNSISLQNIYIEDQTKDTLLYGGQINVDLDMFKLLKSDVEIKEIDLKDITAKVKRLLPDTVFNFKFIADAFASPTDEPASTDTSAMKMNIDNIIINNSHVVYKDVVTGNDLDLYITHFDSPIETFDINHMLFDIPKFTLSGVRGHFYQNEPLQPAIVSAVANATQTPETFLQLKNKEISFKDIDFDYKSEPSALSMGLKIKSMIAHPDTLDIKNGKFDLKDFSLDKSDIAIVMSNKAAPPKTNQEKIDSAAIPSFTFTSDKINISGSNFKMDNTSMPVAKTGMDFGHLDVKDLNFSASNLFFNPEKTSVNVTAASIKEKSGFVLNDLKTNFVFTPTGVSLTDLYVKTPTTTIRKNVIINYPSLETLTTNPGAAYVDLDLQNTTISVKDILTFAPALSAQPALSNPSANFIVDGRIRGMVNNLHFDDFRFKGFNQTSLLLSGTISGLPDPKKIATDLNIKSFTTGRRDILALVPPNTIPANITIPENISVSGQLNGNMNNLVANVGITTSLGSAKVKGNVQNFSDPKKAKYDLDINANTIQLGVIMSDPETLGPLTANIKVKGSGLDIASANAKFSGEIISAVLKKYNYKNLKLDGSIANQAFQANASIHDPNIDVTIDAGGKMNGKFPSVHINADIDSIKTLPLNLTPQSVIYHGKIQAEFANTDPDNLDGNLVLTHSVLVNDGKRFSVDSLELNASNVNGIHSLNVKSDFLSFALNGKYKLTQLGDVFTQAIDPYFAISTTKNTAKVDPYNFTLEGGIVQNEALKSFLPGLKIKPININAHFASDSGWSAFANAPYIIYDSLIINDLKLNAATNNGALNFTTSINQFKSGTSIAVYATTLQGSLKNNNLDFTLNIKDKKAVDKYRLSGLLSQPTANNYSFSLKPDSLLLNYTKWSVNSNNSIQYFNKDITANNFVLSQGDQQLSINSTGTGTNKPLSIDFKNFSIATLTAFVQTDSLLVNGKLNGNTLVKNIQVQPVFTTDLMVNDLSVYNDTIGNLSVKVNNNVANTYNANISLTGHGNEVNITGNYFVKPQNSSYDFTVDVASLQMKTFEAFSKGALRDTRGNLYGKIALNGSLDKPNIDGKINFNNTAFVVSSLNNLFKIDKESIAVINNKGIEVNSFSIHDTTGSAITIDGLVNTTDFLNYGFDLTIKAKDFQVINSTKKDNPLFYGKMVFSTNLNIKGTPEQPVVDGDLTINDKTNFSVVLPQSEPGVVQREGIVRFVDYSALGEDSLFLMRPYDSLKTSPLKGYDVSININVNKDAIFNLIVDEGNGDFLRLKGEAQLNGGIDPSGKVTLTGSYEIAEGSYDLSFNFIKRKFLIQKGSKIVWTGEPTTADVDVTGIYVSNTAPYDLVQGQVTENPNIYKQKLPFEVHLGIKGELLKPQITFDVVLPTDANYAVSTDVVNQVQLKLAQLRQEPGELNKQVFALLLLNRFVAENPFDNSSGGGGGASTFARESVSKLLTEQLNQLAAGLIEGVDINFDLASTQDYTTGSQQQRTDFNVGLSKRLLNDRLTVTIGTDFEVEGPRPTNQKQNSVAGNIAIDYKLSKDGRYLLRAYRKNDYTGEIEGYVIETGLGFIISVDYNRFRQIFQKRKGPRNSKNKKTNTTDNTQPPLDNKQQLTTPAKENNNAQ